MKWLNWYGLLFVAVILVPNIVFAATNADGFVNKFSNKKLEDGCSMVPRASI